GICFLLRQPHRRQSRGWYGNHLIRLSTLNKDFVFAQTDVTHLTKSLWQLSQEGNIRNRQSAASGHAGKSWRAKNRASGEGLPASCRQRCGAKLQAACLGATVPWRTFARAVFFPNCHPGIIRAVEAVGEQKAVASIQSPNKLHVPRRIQN